MSAVEEVAGPVPFSGYSGIASEFAETLAYEVDELGYATPRGIRRANGDRMFLSLIDGQPLAEVPEDELDRALCQTQEQSDGWDVYGHEDEPVRQRLDRHFTAAQRRRVDRDAIKERKKAAASRDHDIGLQHNLRVQIFTGRQEIERITGHVEEMEAELAEVDARLGESA